ncbi:MAG: alanine--tRNA ligase [Desulfobacterales bacterium]|nr:alanine--tRNA ligase [Desulfobacterales bacterium]
MTGNQARKRFIDYFTSHQHKMVRSSSLVPKDDPTLLFTNAGMVQFKRVFMGEEKRDYTTAVTSQKCVRAGGKHNDLENVGYTARHHTFFEMLGNFSFGDYFKKEAIAYAWDLLINGYQLPKDRLWISVFHDDDDAYDIWHKQIGIPSERIIRLGEADNFWAMGDTGPCGPCSEIHYDRGDTYGCGNPNCNPACDCDRFLEIWNLVFMQYNRNTDGSMIALPKPSIDTGMGLERIASILQQTPSNYETDLFWPIIQHLVKLSKKEFGQSHEVDVAIKVISDHSRSTAFLIGDGVMPSNEGRGYVLRRIMRRAIRYGRHLELHKPFLHQTTDLVVDMMTDAYPELHESKSFIMNVVENEEARFIETLDKGLGLLNDTLSQLQHKGRSVIPGDVIFKLYDTYGFPVDVVRDVIKGHPITLDMKGFEAAMDAQREKSRSIAKFTNLSDGYKQLASKGILSQFLGYDHLQLDAAILLLVDKGHAISSTSTEMNFEVVTTKTPFYAESGGQVGDTGKISGPQGEAEVLNTIKDPTGILIHQCRMISGIFNQGETVHLSVDAAKRQQTALNHTATHILHAVLRQVVGDHVKQAGSMVSPDRLRFDFSHFSQIDKDTLNQIEIRVNEQIRRNIDVSVSEMDADQAFKTGAIALFEEKYGDRVRVVTVSDVSKEFCGGTHTQRTGNIGFFKILSEQSVASGIRRIEAITGEQAVLYIQHQLNCLNEASQLLKEKPESLVNRIQTLISNQKSLEKEIEKLKRKSASSALTDMDSECKVIQNIKVLAKKVTAENPAALRDLADKCKDQIKSGVVLLGASADNKAMLIVVVTKDLTQQFHAGKLIKEVSVIVGGSGGGRPDMAQAGGSNPENLDQAISHFYTLFESK